MEYGVWSVDSHHGVVCGSDCWLGGGVGRGKRQTGEPSRFGLTQTNTQFAVGPGIGWQPSPFAVTRLAMSSKNTQ